MKKKYLYNPFERIAGWQALLAGVGVMAVTAVVGVYANVNFTGALDAHFGMVEANRQSIPLALLNQVVNLLSLSIVMWLGALIMSRGKTHGLRFIDFAGTQALARAPYLLIALSGFLSCCFADTITFLAVGGFIMMVLVIWAIALMFNACKLTSGLKGTQAVVFFIVTAIIAEVISLAANFGLAILLSCSPVACTTPAADAAADSTQTAKVETVEMQALKQTAAKAVEAVKNKDFDALSAYFDTTMKNSFTKDKWDAAWLQISIKAGKLKAVDDNVKISEHEDYQIFDYPCRFSLGMLTLRLVFNKEQKVSGFFFLPAK